MFRGLRLQGLHGSEVLQGLGIEEFCVYGLGLFRVLRALGFRVERFFLGGP